MKYYLFSFLKEDFIGNKHRQDILFSPYFFLKFKLLRKLILYNKLNPQHKLRVYGLCFIELHYALILYSLKLFIFN